MSRSLSQQHTAEVTNLSAINDRAHYTFDSTLLEFETSGEFWETLAVLDISLAVSREYEHFIVLIGAPAGKPWQSPLPLPHPSGMAFDPGSRELIVSSTRTPNLIFWMRELVQKDWSREIVPTEMEKPEGCVFLPFRSTILPGSLYIHEIALVKDALYATITGHNFVARLGKEGGWKRVWWPCKLDEMGPDAFRQNFFQLNGMAAGDSLASSYFSSFSDVTDGVKPWKQGYGPSGKGVVFSGETRDVICRGLTCPHSPRLTDDALWLCNSGYGELSRIANFRDHDPARAKSEAQIKLPGFTRGLAFLGDLAFVGLSRVIEAYEPYAPGLDQNSARCGVSIVDVNRGQVIGSLIWPAGYQVFDIQIVPGARQARLPFDQERTDEVNALLHYLG